MRYEYFPRYGVQPGTIVKVSCLSDTPTSAAAAEDVPAEHEAEVSHLPEPLSDYVSCFLLAKRRALLHKHMPAVCTCNQLRKEVQAGLALLLCTSLDIDVHCHQ